MPDLFLSSAGFTNKLWRHVLTLFAVNNRGTVDWCLFGRFAEETNPKVSTTYPYNQCHSKCQAIYDASDYRIKSDPQKYDYCDTSGDFITNAKDCVNCLYSSQNLTILGNSEFAYPWDSNNGKG